MLSAVENRNWKMEIGSRARAFCALRMAWRQKKDAGPRCFGCVRDEPALRVQGRARSAALSLAASTARLVFLRASCCATTLARIDHVSIATLGREKYRTRTGCTSVGGNAVLRECQARDRFEAKALRLYLFVGSVGRWLRNARIKFSPNVSVINSFSLAFCSNI